MREEIIRKTGEFVKHELDKLAFYKNNIPRMAEYRLEHSYRVASIGAEIARSEGFDEERTYVACLMHDIGYSVDFKDKADHRMHGHYGAKIARPFLEALDYTPEQIDEMCLGIQIHVFGTASVPEHASPLALTVGDADKIDRYDTFRLYEGLQDVDYRSLSLNDQLSHVENKLNRLKALKDIHCGTATAEKMWQEKLDYQIEFYRRLEKQIDNSK